MKHDYFTHHTVLVGRLPVSRSRWWILIKVAWYKQYLPKILLLIHPLSYTFTALCTTVNEIHISVFLARISTYHCNDITLRRPQLAFPDYIYVRHREQTHESIHQSNINFCLSSIIINSCVHVLHNFYWLIVACDSIIFWFLELIFRISSNAVTYAASKQCFQLYRDKYHTLLGNAIVILSSFYERISLEPVVRGMYQIINVTIFNFFLYIRREIKLTKSNELRYWMNCYFCYLTWS